MEGLEERRRPVEYAIVYSMKNRGHFNILRLELGVVLDDHFV